MTDYTSTTHVDKKNIRKILSNDPYLSNIYKADSLADLTAIVDLFGITDPQHKAAMLGICKLNLVLIRKLEKIL